MPDGFDETNIWLNVDQIDDGPAPIPGNPCYQNHHNYHDDVLVGLTQLPSTPAD